MLNKLNLIKTIKTNKNYYRRFANYAYINQPGTEPLVYKTFGQQIERAVEKYGSLTAIKSCQEQQQLSFKQAYEESATLAEQLKSNLNLKTGDHLAIWAPNTIQWYITFLAAALGGFPLVAINPALQKPELEYALNKARVKTLVTMDKCGQLELSKIVNDLHETKGEYPQSVLMKTSNKSTINNFHDYDNLMKVKSNNCIPSVTDKMNEIEPESPFVIQFTSGTTGQPKAALLSNFSMVNQGICMGQTLGLETGDKSICLQVPMFHVFGLAVMSAALNYGSCLCLPNPTFNAPASLACVENERCTTIVGTPTMYVDLLDKQNKLNRSIDSLELAVMGGAACSPQLLEKTKKILKLNEMKVAYGQSEAAGATFAHDGTESSDNSTVGKIYKYGEAKVVDDQGKLLRFGEAGELWIRGWFNMLGYYEDELKTKETLTSNGWLKTGDQFFLDPKGCGRHQGRKKELIIRGGENIFPKEIEDFLDQHESVLESQVIGVPDERLGEEVCAYLRLKSNAASLDAEDIKLFCKDRLAYFKIPKYVRILEEFPKTTSGKIQKFKLQEIFAADMKK